MALTGPILKQLFTWLWVILLLFPTLERNSRDNEEHLLIICISDQFQYYSLLRLQIFLKRILEMAFANNYQIL